MFDSNQVLEFLRSQGAQLDPGVADDLKGLISNPSFQEAAQLAVENMLWVRDPELKKNLDRASGRLPAPIHAAIGSDLAETLDMMTGMLSPDENSIVLALEQLSPAEVGAVRDYTMMWPDMVRGMVRLLGQLRDHEEARRASRLMSLVSPIFSPMRLETRFMMFGLFVVRAATNSRFLTACRGTRIYRPGRVLIEFAKRHIDFTNASHEELSEVVRSAGVAAEHESFWLGA
jgi:hypothetical protein